MKTINISKESKSLLSTIANKYIKDIENALQRCNDDANQYALSHPNNNNSFEDNRDIYLYRETDFEAWQHELSKAKNAWSELQQ